MKHLIKSLIALTLLLCMLLCSCSAKPKLFECEELQMELTNRFREVEQTGCTALYSTNSEVAVLKKEPFASLASTGLTESSTLTEYAETVILANELSDTEISEKDGVIYFTYESTVDKKTYSYLATVHKSDEAFWLIQFSCLQKKYAEKEATFFAYAESVRFSEE